MATTMALLRWLMFLWASTTLVMTGAAGSRPFAMATSSSDRLIQEVCSGSMLLCATGDANMSKKIARDSSILTINDLQADFFVESALVAGNKMRLAENLYDPAPTRPFLTSAAANALPTLAPYHVDDLVKYFGVARDSEMATAIATAAYLCGTAALPGEARSCATSVASMGAFVAGELGHEVTTYSTRGAPASTPPVRGSSVTLMNVAKGSLEEGKTIVVCHHIAFPSMLFYCHRVQGTKVVQATLKPADSISATPIQAVGICHIDTAQWLSRHPAFAALKIARGEEACHWLVEGDLVFAPAMPSRVE